jgi:hypothetical protein
MEKAGHLTRRGRADGEPRVCEQASEPPVAQRYVLV